LDDTFDQYFKSKGKDSRNFIDSIESLGVKEIIPLEKPLKVRKEEL